MSGSASGLKPREKQILLRADHQEVELALSRISLARDASWLPPGHSLHQNSSTTIRGYKVRIDPTNYDDFSEYVAVSSFVHCGDAWGYLGRAVDALVRGDVQTAIHLAYYAELRGAISLLATEGIYVGNRQSFALGGNRQALYITDQGTHVATWACFQAWKGSQRASQLISGLVKPAGGDLAAWAAGMSAGTTRAVIDDLLTRMELDLQSFADDRSRRNSASYEPSRISVDDQDISETIRIVSDLWKVLEPESPGSFPNVDNQLLHSVLVASYKATNTKVDGAIDWSNWDSWLRSVAPLTPSESHAEMLQEFIKLPEEEMSLHAASSRAAGATAGKDTVEGMFTRAAVLLRIATGACSSLSVAAGWIDDDFDPWTTSLGQARGIWGGGFLPEISTDLWADTELALDSLDACRATDRASLYASMQKDLTTLGQMERVAVWGFSSFA